MAEAREVFDKFDADGSGSIDASELKDALDAADMDVSPEEVLALLAVFLVFLLSIVRMRSMLLA